MRTIDRDQAFAIIAIQQMLYDYCHELDDGAERVTDYFTPNCIFNVGESVWNGHEGLEEHYAADRKAVAERSKDGVRTVRHGLINQRIDVQNGGAASVDLIFVNFSAHGHGPFTHASAPTVVADTRMEMKQGADGFWRIHEFTATPLFFGDDPMLNSVLMEM
ncbi:MAG: nuclear transport factor 2 family protein [Novosphingobium sp.]|nr:nuclear transport factor 2 family protein [Novosphingobium sp.]